MTRTAALLIAAALWGFTLADLTWRAVVWVGVVW